MAIPIPSDATSATPCPKTDVGLYGMAPADLVAVPARVIQFSPLTIGARDLASLPEASLAGFVVHAPPGTVERRAVLALALRALAPGAPLTVFAAKDRGGLRLGKELKGFGCTVGESARRHHRVVETTRPRDLVGIEEAIAAGALRFDADLGFHTQAGIFAHDKIDAGSALLIRHLPALSGAGADLGCGMGVLARAVLESPGVSVLTMLDIDRRAIAAARLNVTDARAIIRQADATTADPALAGLDFVVMNPPFHRNGIEDRALGQIFIRRAAEILRPGGMLHLTANRHLPYEDVLRPLFKSIVVKAETDGYKIIEARR